MIFHADLQYPTEYVKTQLQLQSAKGLQKYTGPVNVITTTVREKGFLALYEGVGALVVGTAVKAAVRFLAYDQFKQMLVDDSGRLTGPRSLLAGLGAGFAESILAVTPMETIKTKLIHDSNSPNPKYKGLVHGTGAIIKAEGIQGIYRGLFPVMMRQGANSAVRFSTYSTLKQFVQARSRPGEPLPTAITFAIGGIAGIVTVYTTMPLDVIKTKMQSLDAKQKYKNSFHCAYKIFTEEGLLRFWNGATPRLARLILSGSIVFTGYEKVMQVLQKMDRER